MSEILVEVTRGNIVECIHRGDIAIVDNKNTLLHSIGNPEKITYMRSAAKPLQTLNVILSGAAEKFNLSNDEISIMCASHYAEDFHMKVLNSILSKINLKKDDIKGGIVTSLKQQYALELAYKRAELTPLHSDCSGKHTGMLSVCVHNNYPIESYLDFNHPCQQEILEHLAYMIGLDKSNISIGIDGCSAPVHSMPLRNMALGFAKLANPENLPEDYKQACNRIFKAMNDYPEMVSGTDGFCTELIKRTNGKLVGKIGAEGVYCIGIKEKNIGIAIKLEDGAMAKLPPIVVKTLSDLNVLSDKELESLSEYLIMKNRNDIDTTVGYVKPKFKLV